MVSRLKFQESHCRTDLYERHCHSESQNQVASALIKRWWIKSCHCCCHSWKSQMLSHSCFQKSWSPQLSSTSHCVAFLPPVLICFSSKVIVLLQSLLLDALYFAFWSLLLPWYPEWLSFHSLLIKILVTWKTELKFSWSKLHRLKSQIRLF